MSAGPFVPKSASAASPTSGAVRATAVASAAACAGVTPGRSRAITLNAEVDRVFPSGEIGGGMKYGRHSRVSRSGNLNSRGMTPTMRNGLPLSVRVWPIALGAPANRSCQNPCDSTISSTLSFVNTCPSCGGTRSIVNTLGVTAVSAIRSDPVELVSAATVRCHAPAASTVCCCSIHGKYATSVIVHGICRVAPAWVSANRTRRSGSGHGSGRSKTASTTLNSVVMTPIASAIVRMATTPDARWRRINRTA
jgi:hypothetical protein